MSSYNYHALLQYLGISHVQFVILLIVGFLITSIVYFFYKLGFLTPIRFKDQILPEYTLVYTSYQGSYDMIQESFNKMMQDVNAVFKMSEPFGIYYDNPNEISDPDSSRAVFGCMVNTIEEDKVKLFLSKFTHYKSTKLTKKTNCIGTKYPFFNALSMILVITRVYPKLVEEIKKRKIEKGVGILEIYKIVQDKNQHIKILFPTQNLQELSLWYPPEEVKTQNESEVKEAPKDKAQ